MNVTAVIPTINEEGTIGSVIDGLLKSVEGIEIIVVDTDSTDRTKEIAAAKGAIVINESRRGYGIAYKTGLKHAKGPYCMHGRRQYISYRHSKTITGNYLDGRGQFYFM